MPLPAMVVMMPPAMRRMRWLALSQISSAPVRSSARALGWASEAAVAGPPSPENPALPLPAKVVMMPLADGADALVAGVGDVECAVRPDGDGLWRVQFGADSCAAVSCEALHPATRNDHPGPGERGLKDLVATGIGYIEIAGGVVSDARGLQWRWCGSLRGCGGRHHAAGCESGRTKQREPVVLCPGRRLREQESPSTMLEAGKYLISLPILLRSGPDAKARNGITGLLHWRSLLRQLPDGRGAPCRSPASTGSSSCCTSR